MRPVNPDIPDSVFQAIVDAIASGRTVQGALDDNGVKRYDYDKAMRKDPLKSKAHARARQDGVDALADEVIHIADTEPNPQTARNRIEARKWLCGVIKPREYGPRMELQVTDTANPAALHDEGRQRVRLMRDLPSLTNPQPIEDAALIEHGATVPQTVSPAPGVPADVAGTIFE